MLSFLSGVLAVGFMGALLFGCAGRWDLPLFWAYLGVWLVANAVGAVVSDPTLARERLRPGPGGQGYWLAAVIPPLWIAQYIVAGLDVGRFHWSDNVSLPVQVTALILMAAFVAVGNWAVAVNRFFSSVVRLQTDRGHHLVTSGPYRFVRHPAYLGCLFIFAGGGLVLGSWLAALVGLVLFLLIVQRTAHEDRFLHEQLPGYAAYARKVRYRLFPGLW